VAHGEKICAKVVFGRRIMMRGKRRKMTEIRIDITDWEQEFRENEPTIGTSDDVVELVLTDNFSTAKAARSALTSRALGLSPQDIVKTDKLLLQSGARAEIASKVTRRKRRVEGPGDRVYEIREFIGLPGRSPEEADDERPHAPLAVLPPGLEPERSFVPTDSKAGMERAIYYLLEIVPGHISARLTEIAAGSGDAMGVAEQLIDRIREIAERLEPVTM